MALHGDYNLMNSFSAFVLKLVTSYDKADGTYLSCGRCHIPRKYDYSSLYAFLVHDTQKSVQVMLTDANSLQ